MRHLLTVSASTKRAPAISGGKRGEPVTNIASILCTPLDPIDSDTARRLNLDTPYKILETYVEGDLDIMDGDHLIVGSKDYPIRATEKWSWRKTKYIRLFLDDLK